MRAQQQSVDGDGCFAGWGKFLGPRRFKRFRDGSVGRFLFGGSLFVFLVGRRVLGGAFAFGWT